MAASLGLQQALTCCRQESGHALLSEIRYCLAQACQISWVLQCKAGPRAALALPLLPSTPGEAAPAQHQQPLMPPDKPGRVLSPN